MLPGSLPGVQAGRAPQNAQRCHLLLPAQCWNRQALPVLPSRPSALSSVACLAPAWPTSHGTKGVLGELGTGAGSLGDQAVPFPPHTPVFTVFTVSPCTRSPPSLWITVPFSPLPSGSHSLSLTPPLPTFLVPCPHPSPTRPPACPTLGASPCSGPSHLPASPPLPYSVRLPVYWLKTGSFPSAAPFSPFPFCEAR